MFLSRPTVALTTVSILLNLSVDAFWRMECRARSGLARIDPLVSNGSVSEHAHAIHGSSGMSISHPLSYPNFICCARCDSVLSTDLEDMFCALLGVSF